MAEVDRESSSLQASINDRFAIHPQIAEILLELAGPGLSNRKIELRQHRRERAEIVAAGNTEHGHELGLINYVELSLERFAFNGVLAHARGYQQFVIGISVDKCGEPAEHLICLVHRKQDLAIVCTDPVLFIPLVFVVFWKECRPIAVHARRDVVRKKSDEIRFLSSEQLIENIEGNDRLIGPATSNLPWIDLLIHQMAADVEQSRSFEPQVVNIKKQFADLAVRDSSIDVAGQFARRAPD